MVKHTLTSSRSTEQKLSLPLRSSLERLLKTVHTSSRWYPSQLTWNKEVEMSQQTAERKGRAAPWRRLPESVVPPSGRDSDCKDRCPYPALTSTSSIFWNALPPPLWERHRACGGNRDDKKLSSQLTSVVAAGILKRLALVDAVEALAAAVEVGRARAPGGPAACSRDSGGAW